MVNSAPGHSFMSDGSRGSFSIRGGNSGGGGGSSSNGSSGRSSGSTLLFQPLITRSEGVAYARCEEAGLEHVERRIDPSKRAQPEHAALDADEADAYLARFDVATGGNLPDRKSQGQRALTYGEDDT
jgi:hypothetical protein